ncbi:MAG: acetate--CoA ligase family protein [Planctomycetes bacterium]|nr:acetate--CoA ligase family protein [Planctomycetota bacterium]
MSLKDFFTPQSVAVVGASREKGKVGHEILKNLVRGGFEGKVFPVNPKADEVEGLKCYPDLRSIGEKPDLVVIVVPSKFVAGVMEECAALGVKSAIVITSGFKEVGGKGIELEQDLLRIARRGEIRFLGPNCLGMMIPSLKLNASFGGSLPKPGRVAYFSQSGSLLAAIVDMASGSSVGFSKLMSIGNKANIDELDILRALAQDEETRVIAGYLETIQDGDAFIRESERISREKPILLMKSGVTRSGARAASSHTGRLADIEMAYECIFERAGVIRCESIKRQFDFARAFCNQPLPAGPRVAIIANAGGPSIMAADALDRAGLELAALSTESIKTLSDVLPSHATLHNPIDLLGDALADRFNLALRVALADDNVDTVLVMLTPHAMTECESTAEAVAAAASENGKKPILACFLGADRVAEAIRILKRNRIPQYDSPENAVATVKAMTDYGKWRSRPKRVVKLFSVNRRKVEQIIDRHVRRGHLEIGEMEAKEILEAYGFVTPKGMVAITAEQAANIAQQIGYPVVLKIWSPDIVHKTEVGGVKTGLHSPQEVMDAFDLMMYRIPKKAPDADILGVLVEEMYKRGQEVILGMNRDVHFGPLMMFGMGGLLVEVLKDVVFYPAPLTADEAREMLRSTRAFQLLQSTRGEATVDVDAIAEGLQRLSQLATEFPQIKEMDVNPFVVGPEGTTPVAVDARISLENSTRG